MSTKGVDKDEMNSNDLLPKEALKKYDNEVTEKKKPFKCDLCISRFLSRNHLEIHVKSKHNSKDENLSKSDKDPVKKTKNVKEDQKMYFCKVCEKEVIQFGHVKTFHIDGNVKCPKCDKVFTKYEKGWFAFVSS